MLPYHVHEQKHRNIHPPKINLRCLERLKSSELSTICLILVKQFSYNQLKLYITTGLLPYWSPFFVTKPVSICNVYINVSKVALNLSASGKS